MARVPACLVGSRGFDSRTRRQNIAEIAQSVERRVEGACVGGSKPSLGTRNQNLVSSVGSERRPTKPEVARSSRARGANNGCVAERPIAAACKAVSHEDTVVRIHPHPQLCRASSTGRAAASKAEGSRFDPVVRCQTSRRSQVAEGIWLQTRRRKPASVRIGPSSPGLVSSADQSGRLLSGGRPFESVTRRQFTSPIAQLAERLAVNQEVRGSRPRRGASSFLA